MSRKTENTGFVCQNCGKTVLPLVRGSYRNHCPFCLYSLHVDENMGDRQSECLGKMKPVSIEWNSQKGYQIVHQCERCGFVRRNILSDDSNQPDNMDLVRSIMGSKIY